MQHARRIIERLSIDGSPSVLKFGSLVLVDRSNGPSEWEAVVMLAEPQSFENGGYQLQMRLLVDPSPTDSATRPAREERELHGILVRQRENTLVFRGVIDSVE
jgi:hypothetical protein